MATDIARLVVSLEARTKAFENALNKANGVANSRARAIEGRFAKMNASIGNSFAGVGKRWLAALAAGVSVGALKNLSDAATRIDNALKVAGLSGEELEKVYGRLRDSAVKNAAPLEALTELYGRAALVQKELGISGEELLGFTDKIAVALRVSGKSAAESSGALLQLSQALGSGVVRAEEFNSVLEGALPIAQAAAAGLKEAGGSVAKLRQLVVDGKVSSEAFFRAFEAGSATLDEKVAGATFTVAQSMGNLQTALIDSVREFNKSTGAAENFAGGINNIAKSISDFDVSGFVEKIKEAGGAMERYLNDFANNSFFERLAEFATGQELTVGQPINLETVEAEKKLSGLEYQVEILRQLIEHNKEMSIDTAGAEAELDELLRKAVAVRNAIAGGSSTLSSSYKAGTPGDPNAMAQKSTLPPAVVKPVSLEDFAAPDGKKKKGGGGKSKQSEFAREIEQIKERTAALQAETAAMAGINPLIDDYGFAVEKATAVHELLNAAQKAGIAITPELRAQIDALATGYATATVEAEKLAEAQDRARDAAEDMRELGKDVLGGFISDLQAGKSASEALANALQKVADKLLEVALNSIFDGGGGGILGGIGAIFGFAKGGIAAHGKPQPMKTFARGGVSRSAAIFGEAGPEAAVPLPDGRRIPVDLRGPGGMGGGSTETINVVLQDDSGRMAQIADQRIQTSSGTIVRVAVQQSRRAIKGDMPGLLANAQTRSM